MAIKVQGTTVIDDSRQLSVTGTSTLGSVKVDSGIVTSVSGVVTYFGDASNLTGLTGASAATYGSSNASPIITVNADGRITGITTAAISGTSAINSVSEDTNPQLGGNLDLNSKLINGTGGINITGVATATAFHTGAEGSAVRITSDTISGPAELFIDPAAVGDDTGAVRIKGDLYVDGTTTQINSTTIELADFIVGIATTATTDSLADGAGITIGPDNTFLYDHSNTSLKSSENLNLATGKTYKINGTDVLSATTLGSNVVNSSLTSVGTLTELNVTGIVTASSFSGNATTASTATLATNADILANNTTDETVYLTFVDGATGSQRLETDTNLTYNPSTNILSTTATYAGGVRTIATSIDNNYCIPFTLLTSAPTSSFAQTDVRVDDGLKYNPDSNILYTTATNANYAGGVRTIATSIDNEYCVPFTLLTSAPTSSFAETDVRVDDGLKYNPNDNILYTTATNANYAGGLRTIATSIDNNYCIPFTLLTSAPSSFAQTDVRVDDGLKYNPNDNILYTTATNATLATNVNLTANNSNNETVYLTFADGATGTQGLETDTNLTYNPSTNIIGGTISNATLATNVNLLANNTTNETVYIPFADGATGSQRLETDTNLTYNPATNTIGGNISNASLSTNVDLLANNTTNETVYIPFADGATGSQRLETDTNLTYNPGTNLISGNISNANLALYVNLLANNTENQTSYIPFADGASGQQRLETDTALTYNPATNLISGNISNAEVATNVSLIDASDDNMTASIVFADGATGSQRLETDSSLTYNPYTALLSGTITSVYLSSNNTTNETVYLTFADGQSGSQGLETDSGLTYNPSTNLISGTISNANLATNVNLTANNSTDETVYLTFADGATGTQGLETDSALTYNPSTNTLTAGTFSGSGSSLTGLTGASAATYGSSDIAPVITVDANGRITGITTAAISGSGAIASIVEDTNPQLGGDLDLNSNDITGTGNMNVTGIITATTFSGSGASLTSIPNSALTNSSIAIGGVTFNLGDTDATPAFDLSDATNYSYSSLTGISTDIVGDTTPQLGGTLETNGNLIKFGDSSGATDDRLMFGADNDLSIYHTGSISYISDQGFGALRILSNAVKIRNVADNEQIANFTQNGSVELYHDNSLKFETTGIGVSIVGTGNTATITGPSELVLDPAAVGDNTGKVVILGDLQVDGTQTVINSTTLTVDDKSIVLASGAADSSAANGAGIEVDGASATFQYAHSGTKWVANKDLQAEAFIKNGGTSSQFLKADGTVDSSTYLTAESDTLDSVTGRGSTTTNHIDVGEVTADGLNISGISTLTNQAEVRSDDGSQGRIDFYCEVSNAHYTRLQAAAHSDYSGNATVTLPSSSGTLLLTNGSGANLTSLNASNLGSGTVPDARFPSTLPAVSGANLTNLTGASAATYGSSTVTPVITVNSDGRITGITTAAVSATGGGNVVDDTNPQLGGDLDLNSNDITGTGNMNVTGIITATSFSGNIISESSVPNSALVNTTIYLGGVNIALGATDATPAFDLSDATNYPYSSLTGISTDIVYDTTPQLGGNLDLNSNNITGTGNIDITGTLDVSSTATFGADADDAVIYGTSKILRMGGSSGFQIQEEGTSAQITQGTGALRFFYDSGNQYKWAIFNNAGSVELYHANNKKFETSNTGVTITGTASATSFSGSGSSLTGLTGASAGTYGSTGLTPVITVDANGRITGITTVTTSGSGGGISEISDDTTPQLGGTLETNGNLIQFGDSSGTTDDRLRFGAGNDLQIWHNGANSYIAQESDVGDLYLTSSNDDNDVVIQTDNGSGSTTDYFRADGSTGEAKLFYYGSEKIKTGHNGVTITGTASATSFSGSGSSLTGLTGASAATYGSSTVTPIITVDSSGRITGITTAATAGGGGGGGSGTVTGISSDGEIIGTGVTAINFVGTGITVSITGSTADITIPTSEKTVHREVATEGQTVVPASGTVEYTVGHCDVYLNGSKLDSTEYTATNGTSVTLTTGASVGDIIEVIGFQVGVELNLVGLADLVDDTTPQLGGPLDLNSRLIQGTGGINITGIATATSFSGSGANLTSIPNSALDNSTISVGGVTFNLGGTDTTPAFNLSDATNYPYTSLTGISTEIVYDTTPQLGGNLDLNSNNITGTGNMNVTGIITATSFTGNITGNVVGDVTGDVTGTADNATNVTVADESSDTSCFPLFVTAATGDLAPKSGSNLTFDSSAGILGATTFQGNLDVAGLLKEGVNIVNGKLSANTNIDLANGMVYYFDTTETATSTPNIRVDASTTLDSAMSVGEAITVVLISSAAAAGYSAQLTIDGAAVTERWLGGSAPSEGGASGLDVYTYTIIKVTSAPAYSVLANLVNFA